MVVQDTTVVEGRSLPATTRKVSISTLLAGALISASLLLHFTLIAQGWPITNSDEGTMGIMALHIAYQGAHPTFFYGQNYMGSWEALIAAGLFHLFGPSLFTLRLGTLLMFSLFLLSLYALSRLLFTRVWAIITVLLAGTGSGFMMTQEIKAIGGYAETLFFCTFLFLCSSWLIMTYQASNSKRIELKRLAIYLSWGLIAGLGIWNDFLIAPPVLISLLLLLFGCRREFFRPLPLLLLLAGLVTGMFPLIFYNLHAAPGQDSLSVFQGLHGSGVYLYLPSSLMHEIGNTFQISLPLMTGEPFCPVTEIPFLGPTSAPTMACTLARSTWSAAYLFLLLLALILTGRSLWLLWKKSRATPEGFKQTTNLRRQMGQMALLLSAILSLFLYTFSSGPLTGPGLHGRYLICLLSATPAVFWPLWQGLTNTRIRVRLLQRACRILSLTGLCSFCVLSLLGSTLAFTEIPSAVLANQNDATLITTLEHLHVSHIYSDYWTCDKIAFESNEHVICAVVDSMLKISLRYNRYRDYIAQVTSDAHATYVLPDTLSGQFQPNPMYKALNNPVLPFAAIPQPFRTKYTRTITPGYVIYMPRVKDTTKPPIKVVILHKFS